MGSAARAFDSAYASSPQRRQDAQPDFRMIPGQGGERALSLGLSPLVQTCFKVACIVIVIFALAAVARVCLSSATAATLMSSNALNTQIEVDRSLGAELEVQRSVLANPTRIQKIASESLAMAPAAQIAYISITDGVLATDSSGALSLAGSLAVLDNATDTMRSAASSMPNTNTVTPAQSE